MRLGPGSCSLGISMIMLLVGNVSLSCLRREGGRPGTGQNWKQASREWDFEATLVKHLDCCSRAFISGVFVAQLFEMFNKAL